MNASDTVFVGLSGGVDSSVAARRLLAAGYHVVGVFIKVWHPDWLECNWEQERRDAMRVAAHLNIPFLTCDAEEAYYQSVARYFIDAYAAGDTPNPDVMCNQYVKFGAFLDFADAHGASYIATGHYAQTGYDATQERYSLHRGVDTRKDQSYFLWTLTQEQLSRTILPLGESTKAEIRDEAAKYNLPTAVKKDSQGICFLGHVDMYTFLARFMPLHEGPVLDRTGTSIGTHRGAPLYTPGQRHGFTVTDATYAGAVLYVHEKDVEHNQLIVDTVPPDMPPHSALTLRSVNEISPLAVGNRVEVVTRYRQTPRRALITHRADETLTCTLEESGAQPVVGQSCVLYDGAACLGGGIISKCQ